MSKKNSTPLDNAELNMIIFNYLKKHECEKCQEKDTIVLDFAYESRKQFKQYLDTINSGKMQTKEDVIAQVEGLRVLCANCIRREMAAAQGLFGGAA